MLKRKKFVHSVFIFIIYYRKKILVKVKNGDNAHSYFLRVFEIVPSKLQKNIIDSMPGLYLYKCVVVSI